MSNPEGRQRGGWLPWIAAAAVAVLVLAGLYWWWTQPSYSADPKLVQEFEQAKLIDDTSPPDSWPQWRGERRDGVSGAKGLLTEWPEQGFTPLWKVSLDGGQSSPAVAGGQVVTMTQNGDKELVLCFDAKSGRENWRFDYPAKFVEGNHVAGPSSTPTIAGERVFTVGATGLMHCLDAKSGKRIWERDLLKDFGASNLRWGTSFSPLVDGELVFVNPGGSKGSVAALNVVNGETVWAALSDPAGYCSPILATIGGVRQVVFLTGRNLVGLQITDGKELWRYPWQTKFDVNASTPLWLQAKGDGQELHYFFVSSGYDKGCALVKVEPVGGSFRLGVAYTTAKEMRTHFSSCVLVGDQVYGFDGDQNAFLTCLDVKTGKPRWKERGFGRGSLLVADGHLLVLSESGRVTLVEPTPEECREKGSWQALEGQCWASPALVGRHLYLRNEKVLMCVDVGRP